jgi:hypothetical protein
MDFVEHTGTFVNSYRGVEELIDVQIDKAGIVAIEGFVRRHTDSPVMLDMVCVKGIFQVVGPRNRVFAAHVLKESFESLVETFISTIALGAIGGGVNFLNVEERTKRTKHLREKVGAAVGKNLPRNTITGNDGIAKGLGDFFGLFGAKGNYLNVAGELIHDDEKRSVGGSRNST